MKVSALACGTNMLSKINQEQANIVLNYALDQGINLIETGAVSCYGPIEEMVGNAVADRRDELWLSTKTVALTAQAVLRDVDHSLKSLKTDHIDVYQLGNVRFQHQLDRVLSPNGALQGLIKAHRQGKINYIGITGHCPDILMKAFEAYPFDNVLFILNMIHPYPLEQVLPYAKHNHVGTYAMRPTGHGALKPASKSLRFALCSGVDVVLSGMYSTGIVDENVATADPEPTPTEWEAFLQTTRQLPSTGCTECGACTPCPHGIGIPTIMSLTHYRERYGLLPAVERTFQEEIGRAAACDVCGRCERWCPHGLVITPTIRGAAGIPQAP
jgi:predicted aldo/keto reductase-like oxidoreductase